MRAALEPLAIRPFRRLLLSYLINETGDVVGIVALALLVYGKTGSAVATAGLFLALNVAPAFLSPILTARVEGIALRRLLPPLYVVEAAVYLALSAVANSFALPAVLVLGLIDGTLATSGRSITRAAVGSLLTDPAQLRAGNGLLNVCFAVAGVGGALLGGVLTGSIGASSALLVDAASFLAIAAILAVTPGLPALAAATAGVRHRLREGLAHIARNATTRALVFGEGLALLFFTLVVPIEVVYARETLDSSEAGFGALLSSWSAGMVLGSLVFVAFRQRSLRALVAGSTALIGVSYLGMGAVDMLAPACAFSVLGGVGNGVQWISVVTAVQTDTPPQLQARVMNVLESLSRGTPALGFLLGGALTALFSAPVAFFVAGAGVCILALAATTLRPALTQPQPAAPRVPHPSRAPSPGWYPDPQGAAPLRWWDGTAWTDFTTAGA